MVNKTGIPTLIGNQTPVVYPVATGSAVELIMYGTTQREVWVIRHSRFIENCENSRLGSLNYDN